ncbi:hypothetical protein [Halorarius litoreus]|uniref:hypothetical protein n=1 Tax=Halorarius litoreus TaxID=2962676 RepID=UPI0020CF57FD|nr:hypothetical protein [Halorarius litoreus]
MQRRVAAIYFVFFLVMGASAYSVIALAESPTVEVPGDTYSQGDSFTVNNQEFTVTEAALEESDGGGHGGGGGASYAGTLTYTNTSFRYTATLENNSTVPYQNDTYRVLTNNESDSFTLHQEFNVSAILADDPAVFNTTTTIEGEQYVTYRENNTNRLLSEYLPEPDSQEFSTGDSLQYQGNETTVASVSASEVTLEWTGDKTLTHDLAEGSNVTLAGTQYFAHFSGHDDSVQVTIAESQEAYPVYNNELARQDYFHERMNGLWGIVILAGVVAALIVALAMMPIKG